MDDLFSEFITETQESLTEIDAGLIRLEENPNDKDLLGKIFRVMHTIKGTCGFLGLPRLEKVAHSAENLLDLFRSDKLAPNSSNITLIFKSIDRVRFLLGELENHGAEPQGDDSDLIQQLAAAASGEEVVVVVEAIPEPEPVATPTETIEEELSEADLESLFGSPTSAPTATIEAFIPAPKPEEKVEAKPEVKTVPAPVAASAPSPAPSAHADGEKKDNLASQTLRVNVETLENLMTMVSELVLTRNQLMQIAKTSEKTEFVTPLQRLNYVVSDLQEGIMKTRMQPVGNAWSKLPRIIRDIAEDMGKKIKLEMNGEETELDRQVLELIKDPLLHMVRNSADHGIEDPATRLQKGKPEAGTIVLNAYHEGGHILIEIQDDGKGLDIDRVRQKIVERGLATADKLEGMTDKQVMPYIFLPGFSTAEKVTSVSGRGVGMDVVKTNIEKIGGTIELDSLKDRGTKFTIKIPLTLAIISALIVEVNEQQFAIPQLGVQELVRVSPRNSLKIEVINKAPVLRLRERLLPIVNMRGILSRNGDVTGDEIPESCYIVVVSLGSDVFGVMVDRVFDTEEIVVKPVASVLKSIPLFSGNTILGNGDVIMILDIAGIARVAGNINASNGDARTSQREQELENRRLRDLERISFLVFKAGDETPKAVQLGLISRIEEFPRETIEFSDDSIVVQYRGQIMNLHTLGDFDRTRSSYITLVFSDDVSDSKIGLIVDQVVDINEDHLNIEKSTERPGFMGTNVINGRVTDILDVSHYLKANKNWFGMREGQEAFGSANGVHDKPNILIVDDSPFLTNMLKSLLMSSGYNVFSVENPVKALELNKRGATFDLILSDIEMPEMDGFAFVDEVKRNTSWKDIPVIALTSHNHPDDIKRGYELGFFRYVHKFDKADLFSALNDAMGSISAANTQTRMIK